MCSGLGSAPRPHRGPTPDTAVALPLLLSGPLAGAHPRPSAPVSRRGVRAPAFRPGGNVPSCIDPCSRERVHLSCPTGLPPPALARTSQGISLTNTGSGRMFPGGQRPDAVQATWRRGHSRHGRSVFLPVTWNLPGCWNTQKPLGLPAGQGVKDPPADAGGWSSIPGPGGTPHAVGGPSLSTAGAEAASAGLRSAEDAETESGALAGEQPPLRD